MEITISGKGNNKTVNVYDKNGIKLWQIDLNKTGKNYSVCLNEMLNGVYQGSYSYIHKK